MLKKIGENNKIKYLLMNTNKTENEAQSDLWTRAFEEDLEVGSNAGGGNTKSLFDEGPPGEINMQEDASSSAVCTALKDKSEEYYGIVDNWIKDSRRGEKGVIEEIEEGGILQYYDDLILGSEEEIQNFEKLIYSAFKIK